jgi:hypothetical protein
VSHPNLPHGQKYNPSASTPAKPAVYGQPGAEFHPGRRHRGVIADRGSPALEQLALADLITRGEFDRHLRWMRPVYRRRRDALLSCHP